MQFLYPATLTPDPTGGFVVTFRDWPEAITQGETVEGALLEAADCPEEAVAARIDDRGEIPASSACLLEEHPVAVPIQTALKAALFLAVGETGIGPTELARRLGILADAERIDDLGAFPSNRCEALGGDRAGQFSIRVNSQWWICFTFRDGDALDVEITDYH